MHFWSSELALNFEHCSAVMDAWKKTGEAKAEMVAAYLLDFLQGSDDDQKVLVFAHHRDVIDVLEAAVMRAGYERVRVDGSTLPAERQRCAARFQDEAMVRVAILSMTAEGQGLTLTAAALVLFAELHRTPGTLLQAEDQAHRLGQLSSVQIVHLVCFSENESLDKGLWHAIVKKVGVISQMIDGCRGSWTAADSSSQACAAGVDSAEDFRKFFSDIAERAAVRCQMAESDLLAGSAQSDIRALLLRNKRSSTIVVGDSDSDCEMHGITLPSATRAPAQRCSARGCEQASSGTTEETCEPAEETSALAGPFDNDQFSVSPHTGRVALHDRRTGAPFGIVFVPGSLKHMNRLDCMISTFVQEWRRLRAIERRELSGRLLSLPLHTALASYSRELDSSTSGKSRTRDLCFERYAKPSVDSVKQDAGSIDARVLDCCGWCRKALPKLSPQQDKPQMLQRRYCSRECWIEVRIRGTFQCSAICTELFALEHGVCQLCGCDAHALFEKIHALTPPERFQALLGLRFRAAGSVLTAPKEGYFWQADHIIAVAEGGGSVHWQTSEHSARPVTLQKHISYMHALLIKGARQVLVW